MTYARETVHKHIRYHPLVRGRQLLKSVTQGPRLRTRVSTHIKVRLKACIKIYDNSAALAKGKPQTHKSAVLLSLIKAACM
jgi:hypothetical protein